MTSDANILVAVASGGIVNTGVLMWLGAQFMTMRDRIIVMETHMSYIRRDVAYLNGRAEPSDEEGTYNDRSK